MHASVTFYYKNPLQDGKQNDIDHTLNMLKRLKYLDSARFTILRGLVKMSPEFSHTENMINKCHVDYIIPFNTYLTQKIYDTVEKEIVI